MNYILEFNKFSDNYKLIFSDDEYDYYRVYNNLGIREIGSPDWCIKYEDSWLKYVGDKYTSSKQYVIIKKGVELPVPNDENRDKYGKFHRFKSFFGIRNRYHNETSNDRIGITYDPWMNKSYAFDDNNVDCYDTDLVRGMIKKIKENDKELKRW